MRKIKPIMALNNDLKSDILVESCNFGNGWGLFVEIDIIDTINVNKYNYTKNTLDVIIEDDDIEKNLEEIYVMKPNSPNKKRVCYKSPGCFSTLCVISLMAYFIICVI
jgi:hypothetical protein